MSCETIRASSYFYYFGDFVSSALHSNFDFHRRSRSHSHSNSRYRYRTRVVCVFGWFVVLYCIVSYQVVAGEDIGRTCSVVHVDVPRYLFG